MKGARNQTRVSVQSCCSFSCSGHTDLSTQPWSVETRLLFDVEVDGIGVVVAVGSENE